MDEHFYIVTYDICDPKRWRKVFRLMKGFGEWIQLSVFQCRLNRMKYARLIEKLDGLIKKEEDQALIMDLGLAAGIDLRVISLGRIFRPIERKPIVV